MGKTLRIRLVEKGYIPRDFTEIYGIHTHLRYNGEYRYSWDGFREALKSALDNNDWETIPILSAVLAHTVSNYYGDGNDENLSIMSRFGMIDVKHSCIVLHYIFFIL
jgi:hypothetical protein